MVSGRTHSGDKLLVTEHQQQYDQRHTVKSVAPQPEEFELIRDGMLYNYLSKMIQRSMDDVDRSKISMKKLVFRSLEVISQRISDDQFATKKELNRRNIKTWIGETNEGIMHENYRCRGYEGEFSIVREVLVSQIELKLGEYAGEIEKAMKR